MARRPFKTIRVDRFVLGYLANQPEDVADCLRQAFLNIRLRRLSLDSPGGFRQPFVGYACMHHIFVSINASRNIVVVVGVAFDPPGDLP